MWKFSYWKDGTEQHSLSYRYLWQVAFCVPVPHIYTSVGYCVVYFQLGLSTTFNKINESQLHTFFVCNHISSLIKIKYGKSTVSQAMLILATNNQLKLRNVRVQLWDYWIYYLGDVLGVDITLTSSCADCQMVLGFEDAHIVAMRARLHHKHVKTSLLNKNKFQVL